MRSRPPRQPEMSPGKKHDLAQKLLLSARLPQQIPKGFDPLRASPEDLKSFGLPPRPENTKDARQAAAWERLMSKPMKFVPPTFEVVKRNRVPLSRKVKESASEETYMDYSWSGAIICDDDDSSSDGDDDGDNDDDDSNSDYAFNSIRGTWVVPNPYPGSGGEDVGIFLSAAWIGIDGWNSDDTLQGGTEHDITYSTDQKKWVKDIYAWYGWYPSDPIKIKNFGVSPGDTVTCFVWTYTDDKNNTKANFYIYNWNSQSYTSVNFDPPEDVTLVGDSAEWIMEAGPIPVVGTVPFSICWANSNGWLDLSSASIIDMSSDDTTEYTAEKEGDTSVIVYNSDGRLI